MLEKRPSPNEEEHGGFNIKWVLLLVALFVLMSIGSVLLLRKQLGGGAKELPIYDEVPDFQLVERSGKPFSRTDLSGIVWIADFIFTRCPGMCPVLSTRMAALQQQLQGTTGRPVRLVSFSVDPEWDTPERLQQYAERYHAHPEQWLFLTGPSSTVTQLVTQGFHLSLAPAPADGQSSTAEPIIHSDRLVLVDPSARIRGYYHGAEQDSVDQLWRDLEVLRRE